MRAWICYDLRTLDNSKSSARLAREAIEQLAWADDKPFEAVVLPEHHGCPDGYLPSPFVLGAAIAARTKRIRLIHAASLLPLLNPIRVAEDAATLDLINVLRGTTVPDVRRTCDVSTARGLPARE
jgi:alkanesulfonate monooxygenase SsuD/methylene tetrahydromethanopterin reductase-like flavin-dependent oxidoreductase (luciferase family)